MRSRMQMKERSCETMPEDDSYLYLNEGGFTPGMYRPARKPRPAPPMEHKWSPLRFIPGVEIGGKKKSTPPLPPEEWRP
jgi:hypothetical protein